MKYDYLIVGAGLFGAVFAHEAVRAGKKVLVMTKEIILREISTPRKWTVFRYTDTVRTFSTPPTGRCGIMCSSLLSLIVIRILPWQDTKMNYTTCLSI